MDWDSDLLPSVLKLVHFQKKYVHVWGESRSVT